LNNEVITRKAEKGCPQGGVLSPLLWDLVMEEILSVNTEKYSSIYTQGFADDLANIASGPDLSTVGEQIQQVLLTTEVWCRQIGLSLNDKSVLVHFTTKLKFKAPIITLNGKKMPYSESVKYLGVTIDKRLTWGPHSKARAIKAMISWAQSRRAVGPTWG